MLVSDPRANIRYGLGSQGMGYNITPASFSTPNVMANVEASARYYDARSAYGDNDPRTQAALAEWNQTRNVIGADPYIVTTPTNPSIITPQMVEQGSFDENYIYTPNTVIPPAIVPSQPVTVNTQPTTTVTTTPTQTTTPVTQTTNTNTSPSTTTTTTPVTPSLLDIIDNLGSRWQEWLTPGGGSQGSPNIGTGSSVQSSGEEWIAGVPNWAVIAGGLGVVVLGGMAFSGMGSRGRR